MIADIPPSDSSARAPRQFPCTQCGAMLQFAPGTDSLVCSYCGTQNVIVASNAEVPLLDYLTYSSSLPVSDQVRETLLVHCTGCGAETQLANDTTAGRCAFCGAAVIAETQSQKAIKPGGLLPFLITRDKANAEFRKWIAGRWFAPSALVRQAERSGIDGAYIPAWTYFADTTTPYVGERGEDYQETETYTEYVNGQPETRTRMVTRTRWWPASGIVNNRFEDLLVLATRTLPSRQAERLEPWDLSNLLPYADEYLSGFVCQSYQVDLPTGFESAKALMAPVIQQSICQNIGGDHQRIHSSQTRHDNVRFRHLLLPLWISAYRFGGKTFRFLVNARTGEVQGERPYSAIKISILIAAIILLVIFIVLLARSAH